MVQNLTSRSIIITKWGDWPVPRSKSSKKLMVQIISIPCNAVLLYWSSDWLENAIEHAVNLQPFSISIGGVVVADDMLLDIEH